MKNSPIIATLKWVLGFLLLNIVLGFVMSMVGKSTDSEPLTSYPLKALPEVAESANAYYILPKESYDYDQYDLKYEVNALLRENWDMQKAQRLLADNRSYLDLLDQANAIGLISSEETWNEFGISEPGLELIAGLNRLESNVYAEQGDVSNALESWHRGLIFAEMIKKDAVLTPNSFRRGIEMVDEQLSALHRLISRHKISDTLLKQTFEKLESVSDLNDDAYGLVYSGELRMLDSAFQGIYDESLWERAKLFRYFGMSDFMGESKPFIVRIVEDWGRIFAPAYFAQKEASLNSYRPALSRLQTQVDIICSGEMDWGSPSPSPIPGPWFNVFKPNSTGSQQVIGLTSYRARSEQRCLMSMHLRALKLNVAIRRYEQERKRPLENLLELVPAFIKQLPIDPMSNKLLVFDQATKSIIAVGTDAVHSELSDQKAYSPECSQNTACRLNPMVTFNYQEVAYDYDSSEFLEMLDVDVDESLSEFEDVE